MKDSNMQKLLKIVDLAIVGKNYSKDDYDIERFEQIIALASELISDSSDIPSELLLEEFMETKGYITPKIGTRAAIIKDKKILLVKETTDGLWSLPGGWMDNHETIVSNTIKESKEEAGVDVKPQKVVTIVSKKSADLQKSLVQNIVTMFILCEPLGGTFTESIEISDMGYFSLDDLPPLSVKRNTYEQIEMCFDAYHDVNWQTTFI